MDAAVESELSKDVERAVKALRRLREEDWKAFARALAGASPVLAREVGNLLREGATHEAP